MLLPRWGSASLLYHNLHFLVKRFSQLFSDFFRNFFFRLPKDILAEALFRDSFDIISYSDLKVKRFSQLFSDFFGKFFAFDLILIAARLSSRQLAYSIIFRFDCQAFFATFFRFFSEGFPKEGPVCVAHPPIGDSLHTLPYLEEEVNCFYAVFCFFSRFFSDFLPHGFHAQDVVFSA